MRYLFILLLLLTGCTFLGGDGGGSSSSSANPFAGGDSGLVLKFLPNAPPSEILDDGNFPFIVEVEIENKGEFDIDVNSDPNDKAVVRLVGIFYGDFKDAGSGKKLTADDVKVEIKLAKQDILGKHKDISGAVSPGGKIAVLVPIAGPIAYKRDIQGHIELPFTAELCYNYKTFVSAQYCLVSNVLSTKRSVCNPNTELDAFNSGAPVQITSIEQNIAGAEAILFTFDVKLMEGDVFAKGKSCSRSDFEFLDIVEVLVDPVVKNLKDGEFVCSGIDITDGDFDTETGDLKLFEDKGRFTCTFSTKSITSDSVRELKVTLTYDHLMTAEKLVTVRTLTT